MFIIIALLHSKYKMVSLALESDEKDLEPKLEKTGSFLTWHMSEISLVLTCFSKW
jgi:hypothetical protein